MHDNSVHDGRVHDEGVGTHDERFCTGIMHQHMKEAYNCIKIKTMGWVVSMVSKVSMVSMVSMVSIVSMV